MAYAKLVFPAETYALKKLKEIARFATGQISSVSDLEFADQSLSEIVITDAPGWTLEAQSFESTGTATVSQYRLTAPCLNSSKNKCLRIQTSSRNDYNQKTGNATWDPPSSTATSAYATFVIGSSWSSTTLNNSTGWIGAVSNASSLTYNDILYAPQIDISGVVIYVFSSQRKLIVFSEAGGGKITYGSALEFPETQHAIKHSNIPCLVSTVRWAHADSPLKLGASGSQTIAVGSGQSATTSYYYYYHFFTNWYNPALGNRANRSAWDYGSNNVEFFSTPSLNITSAGQTAYPLIPMTDIRTVYGEGIHNYSALTDMYITYRESAYVGHGDTIDVNGTDYVIMQVGDSTANYRAFAIKKG